MHEEYIKIKPNADTAVLFIHGIIGTPDHFVDFLPIVPEEYSVYNMLLDGHGKTVEDFCHTSMMKWKEQVSDVVKLLSESHSHIIIVAHSMGTLFAISEAVKNPDIVKELFLLASPMKVKVKPRMLTSATKVYFGIEDDDVYADAARRTYGIPDKQYLTKYAGWVPRYRELFREIKEVRSVLKYVKAKTRIYMSMDDELVSIDSIKYLKENKDFDIKILGKSAHFYYEESDYSKLLNEFASIFE